MIFISHEICNQSFFFFCFLFITSLLQTFLHLPLPPLFIALENQAMRAAPIKRVFVVFFLIGVFHRTYVEGDRDAADYSKLTTILIPGYSSTQLRSWSILDCPYSPFDFNPLDLVWLDITKVRNLNSSCNSTSPHMFELTLTNVYILYLHINFYGICSTPINHFLRKN